MKTVLIVSPYFPPSTLAGVHRARHLAKHLPAHGWRPIVVCVHEDFHEEAIDPGLMQLVPSTIETIKVRAVPAKFTRPFRLGEVSLRAWFYLRRALFDAIRTCNAKAVLVTGSPYYPMLLGASINHKFGVPVILDFQDPWVSAEGASHPALSKRGLSHRLALALEPGAVRSAAFVTSVSETQNQQMALRYPWLDPARMRAIPIGGDPEDFSLSVSAEAALDPAFINLGFVGTIMPRTEPLLRLILEALKMLRLEDPDAAARLRLNFIGTSNTTGEAAAPRVLPLAIQLGLGDLVFEIPKRLPYLTALATLAKSHGLLLIGSDEAHYTASKIYPALMSRRPYLSLFLPSSSSYHILSAAGGGHVHAYDPGKRKLLVKGLAASLRAFVIAPDTFGTADKASFAPYEAREIARQFADIFDEVATGSVPLHQRALQSA